MCVNEFEFWRHPPVRPWKRVITKSFTESELIGGGASTRRRQYPVVVSNWESNHFAPQPNDECTKTIFSQQLGSKRGCSVQFKLVEMQHHWEVWDYHSKTSAIHEKRWWRSVRGHGWGGLHVLPPQQVAPIPRQQGRLGHKSPGVLSAPPRGIEIEKRKLGGWHRFLIGQRWDHGCVCGRVWW